MDSLSWSLLRRFGRSNFKIVEQASCPKMIINYIVWEKWWHSFSCPAYMDKTVNTWSMWFRQTFLHCNVQAPKNSVQKMGYQKIKSLVWFSWGSCFCHIYLQNYCLLGQKSHQNRTHSLRVFTEAPSEKSQFRHDPKQMNIDFLLLYFFFLHV